jgi:multicomponent Na+:H+ antiporter subunit G
MNEATWMTLGVQAVALLLLLGAAFFLLVAAVGVLRLPDSYCRAHALGKAMTLGIILLLLAMGLLIDELAWWKVGVAVVFQLVTIPMASHLFCLVAYRRRLRRWSAQGWVESRE